jgi:FAD/FMN-containing dehydrogenase
MTPELRKKLEAIVGAANIVSGSDVADSAWETHQPFHGSFQVCPSTTEQVAQVLSACNAVSQSVVPMGGLTNLVQGCATVEGDIGLSLQKLNQIEVIDPLAQTMTVQAGVTLREAQAAADANNLFYPLDIGARDNCMLGGNVSTNAGGTKVIRYGMIRDSVLGLEAVLADGTVVSSMNRFIKNNSGFDLKHLFIGTEGTLGVITRIVFRLNVKPKTHNVALVACDSFTDVVQTLKLARENLGSGLCGFEVMWKNFYNKVTLPKGRQPAPLPPGHAFYVLIEAMGTDPDRDNDSFEGTLEILLAGDTVVDGVLAKSDKERTAIWAIRDDVEFAVSQCLNFDVSLPIVDVGNYVETVSTRIEADVPNVFVAAFGHLGDNNIHLSVLVEKDRAAHEEIIQAHVYETLIPYDGAISAEHGIGIEKRAFLSISRTPAEIQLMKSLKIMMDPNNILNPGKVIQLDDSGLDQNR